MFEILIDQFETLHPAFFVLGLVLLPLGPVPLSPIWILAGMRFGPVVGICVSGICLFANFGIAYVLSARLFRGQIEQLLKKRHFKVPQVLEQDQVKFTFLIRLIPGMPIFIQNYLLGVVRVKARYYFGIGIPIQLLYMTGFNLFGEALFEGKRGMLIFTGLFLVTVILAVKLFGKHYLASKEAKAFSVIEEE